MNDVHGILVVDKPAGPTSHDIVASARRTFGTRTVGHAGTLDPMARGVLILLFGEATKLSRFLTMEDKRYRARVRFGKATDTLDRTGTCLREEPVPYGRITQSDLVAAAAVEQRRLQQVPPAISALKVEGRRAYRVQRAQPGTPLALPARDVRVRAISLLSFDEASAVFDLQVSKGYYVRAFARDVGATLGIAAHIDELVRLASGPFTLDEAVAWPASESTPLMSVAGGAARALPALHLTPAGARKATYGQRLLPEDFAGGNTDTAFGAWLSPAGRLVAVGQREPDGGFRVVRGFTSAQ